MGEVYRARDTQLHRDVAIKILPADFANDPERVARFEREARTLAALNHPHIAIIYALESAGGVRALVMELVEGEDLSQRIARGAIPIDEALPIAKRTAEALEAAHEQGIIHRDLKPANIKVRNDGSVKVLDFGLAKATAPTAGSSPTMSMSPTITTPAMTQAGMILGTAAYMSPEQARGATVDRRADLWAFGVVLWEMLTGTRLFEGRTVSDTLAAVLKSEPDWQALPTATPPAVRRLLRRCLKKDRQQRLDSAADARLEIEEAGEETTSMSNQEVPRSSRIPWIGAAVAAVIALIVGVVADQYLTPAATRRDLTRLSMSVAPAEQIATAGEQRYSITPRPIRAAFAVAPNGRAIVFSGTRGTATQLFSRAFDQTTATPLDGTKDGGSPVFSPDGQWIAFAAGGKLKKVPTTGGPAIDICDLGAGNLLWGADWGSNGTIAFSTRSAIMRVPSSGGIPQVVIEAKGVVVVVLPHWLPGERGLIYTTNQALNDWTQARVVVRSAEGGEPRALIESGTDARYIPTGHLVYMKMGTLAAVPFDAARMEVTGGAVTLMNDVMQAVNSTAQYNTGTGQFSVAAGTLAYLPGGVFHEPVLQPMWVNRGGVEDPLNEPPAPIYNLRLSPDGRHVAYAKARPDSTNRDIWVYDLDRNAATRLTLADTYRGPVWAPDGQSLIFSSMNRDALYTMASNGRGSPERLTAPDPDANLSPSSVSTSGRLAFVKGTEIWTLLLSGDRTPQLFLKSPSSLSHPAISPDGRWLAYSSDESRRSEVYVQPFPGPGDKTRVSLDGGTEPVWARDGRELFFAQLRTGEARVTMMATDVDTAHGFVPGRPRALFSGNYASLSPVSAYDVSTDGTRFITTKQMDNGERPATQIEIALNWTDELRRVLPRR